MDYFTLFEMKNSSYNHRDLNYDNTAINGIQNLLKLNKIRNLISYGDVIYRSYNLSNILLFIKHILIKF
jgi:hypothetical protein